MVLNNIASFVNRVFQPVQTKAITPVKTNQSYNPFTSSHFLKSDDQTQNTYGKNTPVHGGFFAGYYNGKPNIVGTRLFLEV
ncbi:MAG: hypothetical protein A2287_07945 [Candidatus Melainabacteria bacterium RIFOXYA12_FULL_32_12]|nr:MAG: hypothetical protein A2255_09930 [Candidatus Melainabacteria bacterium RIFOXYA2_FULL_32_9]OGI29758.1 MAG: hypothetical protein A2287_07945 [Candidatus Melainabacteria bacterium RIFOXYA12_FULL_32_12]